MPLWETSSEARCTNRTRKYKNCFSLLHYVTIVTMLQLHKNKAKKKHWKMTQFKLSFNRHTSVEDTSPGLLIPLQSLCVTAARTDWTDWTLPSTLWPSAYPAYPMPEKVRLMLVGPTWEFHPQCWEGQRTAKIKQSSDLVHFGFTSVP